MSGDDRVRTDLWSGHVRLSPPVQYLLTSTIMDTRIRTEVRRRFFAIKLRWQGKVEGQWRGTDRGVKSLPNKYGT